MKNNKLNKIILIYLLSVFMMIGQSQYRIVVFFESGFVGEKVELLYKDSVIFCDNLSTDKCLSLAGFTEFYVEQPNDSFIVRIDTFEYFVRGKNDSLTIGVSKFYGIDS